MKWLRAWLARFDRGREDREMEEEFRFHLEMSAARNERLGMPPGAARREARLRFGGEDRYREAVRDASPLRAIDDFLRDLRHGARMLGRAPLFTAVAAGSLALGIGASGAIFSVVDGVLLRPPAYPSSEELVHVGVRARDGGDVGSALSVADLEAVRGEARTLAAVGAWYGSFGGYVLSGPDGGEVVRGTAITSGVIEALGVAPRIGRGVRPGEDAEGGARVVVLSHAFWRERYAESPDVLGQTLVLNGQAHTVVGVMPAGFRLPGAMEDELWPVLQLEPASYRAPFFLSVAARLAPSATVAGARAELARLEGVVKERWPESPPHWSYLVRPLREVLVREAKPTIWILFGAVVLLLAIAAANVSNLQLARATSRGGELAVRAALGAGRPRLARQLVTESVLLAAIGGAAGIGLAWVGVRVLGLGEVWAAAMAGAAARPDFSTIAVDARVVGFTVLLTLVIGVVMGIAPVIRVPASPADWLRSGRRAGASRERQRARAALVVAELALALLVVVGAGLLLRTLRELQRVDTGTAQRGVMVARVNVPEGTYPDGAQARALLEELVRRVERHPGVRRAAVSMAVPPDRLVMTNPYTPEGRVYGPDESAPLAEELLISDGYFEALDIPVLAGRTFDPRDEAEAPDVAIVNRTLADRHFGGAAVGKWIQLGDPDPEGGRWTIVGVVDDVKYTGLDAEPAPTVYVPYAQNTWWRSMYIVVRTAGDPADLAPTVRSELAALDVQIPLRDVATMEALLSRSVAAPAFRTRLLACFALFALVLAISGIYGVVAFDVGQRRRETGVRLALGASPAAIIALVLRGAFRLAALGILLGAGAALVATRALRGVLFGVQPLDPAAFAAAVGILGTVALIAAAVPAFRAARTDPSTALRAD